LDSVSVFDDFKGKFRELNTSNFDDDIIVGTIFFTRDAIDVIRKFYRIIGYVIYDKNGIYYPIDIRKNDIAMLEGTYNCFPNGLKTALLQYNIKEKPQMIWSAFFWRWQFMCDWDVFEESGSFIKLASEINGNKKWMRKMLAEKIDFVFPDTYEGLSQMVCGLKKLFGVEFYNKDYLEEVNYLFDSLTNGYHINMTVEEVDTYCYQLCDYVLKRVEDEHV
jgi:hypothetical protein